MFLEEYLNKFYIELLYDSYDENYINSLDENSFIKVYQIFKKYNFYFIEDIILKYLEIFEQDPIIIEKKINKLREKLGDDYVRIIGNNMRYLKELY